MFVATAIFFNDRATPTMKGDKMKEIYTMAQQWG